MAPAKHFKKDPFFFAFNLLGFTDLDLLDYIFGTFEGYVGRDVRKEWLQCYNSESIMKVISATMKVGIFTLISDYFSSMMSGDESTMRQIYDE